MPTKLPPNGQWTQKNVGDATGSIWSSFNLDLTIKQGDTKITGMAHSQSTSSDLANLGLPIAFIRQDIGTGISSSPVMTVAGSRVFQNNSGTVSASFLQDTRTTNPTTCDSTVSDMASFNGYTYVTTSTNAVYKTSDNVSWSTFNAGTSDIKSHLLCQYSNRLYMSRAYSQIVSWDTADTVVTSSTYTLTLPNDTQNVITFIKAGSDRLWIGTINILGGQGHIYSWDGVSGNPVKYNLNSTGVVSGIIKDDVLYTVDTNGRLLAFNGGTFMEISRFPNYKKQSFYNSLSATNDRFIHPNGMAIVEGRINILIKTTEDGTSTPTEEMCPSGIWEYDKDIGLYHKYSISYMDSASPSVTNFGQSRLASVGALSYIKNISFGSSSNGTLLAGVKYYTDTTTTKYGIFYDDNNDLYLKAGYIVTTKISSSAITDAWQKIVLKYNNLLSSSSKIVIKYRLYDFDPIESNITWSSTTVFTSTTDLSNYAIGDEVEIVQGTGAGMCAHISEKTLSNGTYTITLDETCTGVTGTSIARFQKWKKVSSISDITSTFNSVSLHSSADSNFIQIKIWMMMYGNDEVKELDIASIASMTL
jgi:hypothetical protein